MNEKINDIVQIILNENSEITGLFEDSMNEEDFYMVHGDDGREIIVEYLIEEGFPDSVQLYEVDYDLIVTNKTDVDEMLGGFIEQHIAINVDGYNANAPHDRKVDYIEEYVTRNILRNSVVMYRIDDPADLDLTITLKMGVFDYYDIYGSSFPEYFGERIEEAFDVEEITRILEAETDELTTAQEEGLKAKIDEALSDEGLAGHDLTINDVSYIIKDVQPATDYESIAEKLSSYAQRYLRLTEYFNSGQFPYDLLEEDVVHYEVEIKDADDIAMPVYMEDVEEMFRESFERVEMIQAIKEHYTKTELVDEAIEFERYNPSGELPDADVLNEDDNRRILEIEVEYVGLEVTDEDVANIILNELDEEGRQDRKMIQQVIDNRLYELLLDEVVVDFRVNIINDAEDFE